MNRMFIVPPDAKPIRAARSFGNVKMWDSPTVAELAGVEHQVLLGWRRRHRFLGGPRQGAQGKAGYWHDLTDVLVACTVAEIIARGIDVESTCMLEAGLRHVFEVMITAPHANPCTVIGCYPQGRDVARVSTIWTLDNALTVREALARSPSRKMLMIDLQPILERVTQRLGVTLP